jgi:hypothetical protein
MSSDTRNKVTLPGARSTLIWTHLAQHRTSPRHHRLFQHLCHFSFLLHHEHRCSSWRAGIVPQLELGSSAPVHVSQNND